MEINEIMFTHVIKEKKKLVGFFFCSSSVTNNKGKQPIVTVP